MYGTFVQKNSFPYFQAWITGKLVQIRFSDEDIHFFFFFFNM